MLTFNLKKEWFEKIKAGEKTHEYREIKPYWEKRIYNNIFNNFKPDNRMIKFCCGYPKKEDKNKILYAYVDWVNITNGKNTDLNIDKDVFDIAFTKLK